MSNTIPNIGDINSQHNKQLNTFHTPSFGDEDFNVASMQMMQQTHLPHPHQMDQYQMQQQPQPNHNLGNNFNMLDESQYMWQQHGANHQMYNMNNQHMMDPQQMHGMMNSAPPKPFPQSYSSDMSGMYNDPSQQQQNHLQQMQPPPNHHYQQPPVQQQQQQQQQEQQMLMMPPPYKSPPMNTQQQSHQQIMSSPTINQSPHFGAPTENGTTSEDSDDSGLRSSGIVNTLKRPSPEPINESPTKAGKMNATAAAATAAKKPKPQRKKKKKDPNEPQKPVSAYALFFRDTQAAIKGQNPQASFGEVSTIVASMWDALAHEHKDVYKKKTEAAKKEYLKTLAVYRATIVSKGDDVEPTKTSPSGTVSPQQMSGNQPSQTSLPAQTPPSQQTPQTPVKSEPAQDQNHLPAPNHSSNNNNLPPPQQQQQQQQQQSQFIHQQQPGHPQSNMQSPPQSLPQSSPSPYQQQFNPNAYKSPPSNQIDYNNMPMHHNQISPMHHQQSPIHPNQPPMHPQMHSIPHQPPPHLQSNQQQQNQQVAIVRPITNNSPQNNWMRHDQVYDPSQAQQAPPPQHQQHGMVPLDPYNHHSQMDNHHAPQPHQASPMYQHQQPSYGNCEGSAPYINATPNQNVFNNNPNLNQQQAQQATIPPHQHQSPMQISQAQTTERCIRDGCTKAAVVSSDWENEYCSANCCIEHCRNIFESWKHAQTHQQSNFVVK